MCCQMVGGQPVTRHSGVTVKLNAPAPLLQEITGVLREAQVSTRWHPALAWPQVPGERCSRQPAAM